MLHNLSIVLATCAQSDKLSHLKKEALSSFGRKGVKFNLNKSTSELSTLSGSASTLDTSHRCVDI